MTVVVRQLYNCSPARTDGNPQSLAAIHTQAIVAVCCCCLLMTTIVHSIQRTNIMIQAVALFYILNRLNWPIHIILTITTVLRYRQDRLTVYYNQQRIQYIGALLFTTCS